ncbi:MAG: hypothetical protein KKI08_12150, partial [Armatimonadetes bacterium]|nr:hypothetical protein [Armatimonadota bacterium]
MSRTTVRVLICLLAALAMSAALAASAKAPNLQISVNQRSFATGQKVLLSLSTYNLKQASVALYPVGLEELAPSAFAV